MGALIAKQPNGRYCRFSSVVDCPTHINMTREDYLNNFTGTTKGREDAEDTLVNYLQPFHEVIKWYTPLNMSEKEFVDVLKEMCTVNPKEAREL
ncbi:MULTISPECIES: hypothetical protein [Bacillus amyloliquefaciens group]|uniref:Uncharacterized protein n=1 Tax=Bacillus amyloliquefaciens TaxID=1390 RepID=A0AAP3YFL8_BACAM|nr:MULTISPECIES: hypothetical protein [Bacillus amyloliquefaciens group]MCA1233303.1 hypothetical protein [Bacillus velezensis]MCA1311403.1 hypothetical protein [Bacillus velezensis]MCA1330360.1 hypothetical protein [Bacillus velezensis]MCM3278256.1 hypothetical protein [Bacillus velezensis]MCM3351376.1 hypothetical protein [Bacillus velezensis]